MKKNIGLLVLQFAFLYSFTQNAQLVISKSDSTDGHPAWVMQGNIYEVNVRQYTAEGTLNAFAKHLARLKSMGVQRSKDLVGWLGQPRGGNRSG